MQLEPYSAVSLTPRIRMTDWHAFKTLQSVLAYGSWDQVSINHVKTGLKRVRNTFCFFLMTEIFLTLGGNESKPSLYPRRQWHRRAWLRSVKEKGKFENDQIKTIWGTDGLDRVIKKNLCPFN